MWNTDKTSFINKYLKLMGVKDQIVDYILKSSVGVSISDAFGKILGKDYNDTFNYFNEKQTIDKLKSFPNILQVFDNGSIWYSSIVKFAGLDERSELYKKNLGSSIYDKYENVETMGYISLENGHVVDREATKKSKKKKLEENNNDNEYSYYFDIVEKTIYSTGEMEEKRTYFSDFMANDPLSTTINKYSYDTFGNLFITETEYDKKIVYDKYLWNIVLNGSNKGIDLSDYKLDIEIKDIPNKINLIKDSIFKKVSSITQKRLYERLRLESLELMKNENLDEVIHSNFTMKGETGNTCTWTLEKVTESSKEIITQMDFKNTKEFREQMLQPSIEDYAKSNCILKGNVKENNLRTSRYRAFSTTNNVITINNIDKDYANYILNEVKKVEPVIYNKRMEQKELQNQNNNEYGYQKVNKKNSGFLDIFLLSTIAGFVAGLLLFIMCLIFKYNTLN